MIKASVLTAITKQIQHEQNNSHAYKAVSLYFGHLNLHGLEAFMAKQVQDEEMHAEKFIQHVVDRDGKVELGAVSSPAANFESPLEAVKSVRDLERTTTEMIHRLFELARQESDYPLEVLLHWYIVEQVEEEKWSNELLTLVDQSHARPAQMSMLDHQWGKRVQESET